MEATLRFLTPVPVIMTGRSAWDKYSNAVSTAVSCGAGGKERGEVIEPQDINFGWTGEKRMSIGKSRRTGPVWSLREIYI